MRGAALYCGPRPQAAVDGSRGGQERTGQEEGAVGASAQDVLTARRRARPGPRGTPAQRQARR